jgi:hypothetical protein
MLSKVIACGVLLLCLNGPVHADDVIFQGLHCNGWCQAWMGIGPERPSRQKRDCSDIVAHPVEHDADLVRLCQMVALKRDRY